MWSPRRSNKQMDTPPKSPRLNSLRSKVRSSQPSTPPSLTKTDSFITSASPRTPVKTTPKKTPNKSSPASSVPLQRTPSKIMFSPPYSKMFGAKRRSPTPPSSEPLSPSKLRLQHNLKLVANKPQEFDEYDEDEFDPWRFIAMLAPLNNKKRGPILPRKMCERMTLVLDLDETLVHCSTDPGEIRNPCFQFDVNFNGQVYKVTAKKRPGFEEFLEHVGERYETIIFTASQRVYADKLLDILDKDRKWIHHRVFRDDCVNTEGNYLKDLNVLGRDLKRTVIVDNSPQAFSYQIDNGMPILSWYEHEDDRELYKIIPFLEKLENVDDVRPHIRDRFGLHHKVHHKASGMGTTACVLDYDL